MGSDRGWRGWLVWAGHLTSINEISVGQRPEMVNGNWKVCNAIWDYGNGITAACWCACLASYFQWGTNEEGERSSVNGKMSGAAVWVKTAVTWTETTMQLTHAYNPLPSFLAFFLPPSLLTLLETPEKFVSKSTHIHTRHTSSGMRVESDSQSIEISSRNTLDLHGLASCHQYQNDTERFRIINFSCSAYYINS